MSAHQHCRDRPRTLHYVVRTLAVVCTTAGLLSCAHSANQAVDRHDDSEPTYGGEVDDGLGELELAQLAPGLLELFGRQPDQGALLLYEAQEHASWVVFDGKVTCLFRVKRSVSSKSSRPVTELGRDDLTAGIGCNPSDQFRNEGTSSTSTDVRYILVSFVLPRVYWDQPWSVDNAGSLEPFETIVTPQSVHLFGTRRDGLRWTGGVKKFLELDISCDCGDITMEALIRP